MPELSSILESKREKEYQDKKFFAALQGVNLDDSRSDSNANAFEDLKAKVFSGGKANDSADILSLQGINAQQAGFGIGMGLEYTDLKEEPIGPF